MRSAVLIVAILSLAAVTGGAASIELVLERSFTIDQITEPIVGFDIKDVDHDSHPEICVSFGKSVLLYSIALDSVLYVHLEESQETPLSQIALVDADNNQIAEIIGTEQSSAAIWKYDLSQNPVVPIKWIEDFPVYPNSPQSSLALNDLMVSTFAYAYDEIQAFYWYGLAGWTVLYSDFPSDTIWMLQEPVGDFLGNINIGGNEYYIVQYIDDFGSGEDLLRRDSHHREQICILDSGGTKTAFVPIILDPICEGNDKSEWSSQTGCLGDLLAGDNYDEIAVINRWDHRCAALLDGQPTIDAGTRLELYQIDNDSTFSQFWSHDVPNSFATDLLFDPGLPGYFLIRNSERVGVVRAVDGRLISETDGLPSGRIEWTADGGKGHAVLIAINGNQFDIYRLDISTGIDDATDQSELPADFILHQPYPNPFNATVSIALDIPARSELKLEVYNMLGQRVATLHDGAITAGKKTFAWQADQFASGVYFVKATTHENTRSVKTVLLK